MLSRTRQYVGPGQLRTGMSPPMSLLLLSHPLLCNDNSKYELMHHGDTKSLTRGSARVKPPSPRGIGGGGGGRKLGSARDTLDALGLALLNGYLQLSWWM